MRDKIVIWPIYFDIHASRKWRKVAKNMAIVNPTTDEILKVIKKIGLRYVKEEKAHPSRWWRTEERVLVEKTGKKSEIIKKIAQMMKELREGNE